MNDFVYNVEEKNKCWYKNICNKSRCGCDFCVRHYKMSSLIHLAGMEGKQKYPVPLKLDKDNTDREAYTKLKDIQNNIYDFVTSGKNLLIYSKFTGNGKTEWAKKITFSWFNEIWPTTDIECRALFISVPRFLKAYIDNVKSPNEYFQYVNDNIFTADLVVWDELNHKEYSDYEHSYLLNVISHRISIGKSNIYTTNYDLPEIEKNLGTRLSSRIVGSSIKVEFKGKDKRSWGIE